MPFVYPWQYWFIALIGPSKCLKQIFQRKVNRVENPNWPETNQLAIYDRGRGFDRDYREQIQLAVRVGLELGASELQVQRTNRSATLALPPYLDVMVIYNSVWDLWLKFWFLMKRNQKRCFQHSLQRCLYFVLGKKTLDFNWFKTLQLFWKQKWKKSLRWKVGISFLPAFRNFFHPFFFLPKNTKIPPEKPPALSPAVYKWWVELEASFFGSALYAYVARLRRLIYFQRLRGLHKWSWRYVA